MNHEGGWRSNPLAPFLPLAVILVAVRPRNRTASAGASVRWCRVLDTLASCGGRCCGGAGGAGCWSAGGIVAEKPLRWRRSLLLAVALRRGSVLSSCLAATARGRWRLSCAFSSSSLFSRCVTVVREPKRPSDDTGAARRSSRSLLGRAVRPSQTWRESTTDSDITRPAAVATPWMRLLI